MSIEALDSALRFVPLAGLALTLASSAWSSFRMRRKGIDPYLIPADDSVAGFLGRIFAFVVSAWLILSIAVAFQPGTIIAWIGVIPVADVPMVRLIGAVVAVAGVALVIAAQQKMGDTWRVGVDENTHPALVTDGVFAISRNPVFAGMLAMAAGGVAIVPNAVTVSLLGVAVVSIGTQIRIEEKYLAEALGEEYRRYMKNTYRWIGSRRAAVATRH